MREASRMVYLLDLTDAFCCDRQKVVVRSANQGWIAERSTTLPRYIQGCFCRRSPKRFRMVSISPNVR